MIAFDALDYLINTDVGDVNALLVILTTAALPPNDNRLSVPLANFVKDPDLNVLVPDTCGDPQEPLQLAENLIGEFNRPSEISRCLSTRRNSDSNVSRPTVW